MATEAIPVLGKKMMKKLSTITNDTVASGFSDFAKKQMLKMGWTEGKGLGKDEQGIVNHVKVKKREENLGLGADDGEKLWGEQWWFDAYNKTAAKIVVPTDSEDEKSKKKSKDKKKDKRKKRKKASEKESVEDSEEGGSDEPIKKKRKKEKKEKKKKTKEAKPAPTFEDLFQATGGALIGRRAYAPSTGKWAREEMQTLQFASKKGSVSTSITAIESSRCRQGCLLKERSVCICISQQA